ncbi:MAG: hypothetical protein ABFE07_29300 [Armatimonadia bacterium]
MKRKATQDYIAEHLHQLVGKKVTGVAKDSDSEFDATYGLMFEDGTIAWIMCDPEGNGPGHLDIVKDGDR